MRHEIGVFSLCLIMFLVHDSLLLCNEWSMTNANSDCVSCSFKLFALPTNPYGDTVVSTVFECAIGPWQMYTICGSWHNHLCFHPLMAILLFHEIGVFSLRLITQCFLVHDPLLLCNEWSMTNENSSTT